MRPDLALHYLPIFIGASILVFPFVLLIIAICLDHIEPLLPFVSDLGVLPPEASLFSLSMNFGSILLIFLILIRYESTNTWAESAKNLTIERKHVLEVWNSRSLVSGLCMCLGFIIVANFRNSEGVFVQSTHNVGAIFGFFSSVFDMWCQSKVATSMALHRIATFRLVLTIWALAMAVGYNILAVSSFALNFEALGNTELRLKWNSSEDGYVVHVMSTLVEWILILSLSPYFFTFVPQFKQFSLSKQLLANKDPNQNIINRNFE